MEVVLTVLWVVVSWVGGLTLISLFTLLVIALIQWIEEKREE